MKPPKSGNCTISSDKDYAPVITISDLKNAMNENDESNVRENKIFKLKTYIDDIVEEGRWDMDDVFKDNDFNDDGTFNCVVYYLAGYLARKLMKKTTCEMCLSGIKNIEGNTCISNAAQLVHLKSKGFLIYPDSNFFILVRLIETSFAINANSPNAFDDTVEHFFNNNYTIPFPCNEHKSVTLIYLLLFI